MTLLTRINTFFKTGFILNKKIKEKPWFYFKYKKNKKSELKFHFFSY